MNHPDHIGAFKVVLLQTLGLVSMNQSGAHGRSENPGDKGKIRQATRSDG